MYSKLFRLDTASARWRQFSNKGYSAFRSLGREVTIGVLDYATLAYAMPDSSGAHMVLSPVAEGADEDDSCSVSGEEDMAIGALSSSQDLVPVMASVSEDFGQRGVSLPMWGCPRWPSSRVSVVHHRCRDGMPYPCHLSSFINQKSRQL